MRSHVISKPGAHHTDAHELSDANACNFYEPPKLRRLYKAKI